MMLFKVDTKKYDSYYVIAKDFNDAKRKVELKLQELKEKESILTEDGSLRNLEEKPNTITGIYCLTEDFIM